MEHLTLSDAAPGKRYTIREIKDEARLVNRLSSTGLVCGSSLEVCQNRPKQPVLVFARDTLVDIGREESKRGLIIEETGQDGQICKLNGGCWCGILKQEE